MIVDNIFTQSAHNSFVFPSRKTTLKQKIKKHGSEEKWGIDFVIALDHYFGIGGNNDDAFTNIDTVKENLDLVEYGLFNSGPYESWISPYTNLRGESVQHPIELKHYDIITPKLNVLVGEELARPFNFRVVNKSSEAISMLEQKHAELLQDYIHQIVLAEAKREIANSGEEDFLDSELFGALNSEEGPMVYGDQGEELESPEDVAQYITQSYTDSLESAANDLLTYLTEYLKLHIKFNRNFIRSLACGREIYAVETVNNDVQVRVVDPRNFVCNLSNDEYSVDKSDALREERWLTLSDIFDEFYDDLTEEEVEKIDYMLSYGLASDGMPTLSQNPEFLNTESNNFLTLRVSNFEWTVLRKYGILSIIDEGTGEVYKELVGEDYKVEDKKDIEWVWVPEKWQGVRIGHNIFTKIRRIPNQFKTVDNPVRNVSNYTGIYQDYPLVDKVKSFQFFYNVIMQQLATAFARAKGKVMLFDISQIPTKQGWDLDKWAYYLDVFGIGIVNTLQKDEDQQQQSKFNQWQTFDLTLGNTINGYIQQLNYLDQMCGRLMGISDQRQGQIQASETVGGVERSVAQSAAITEIYFMYHSEAKKNLLALMLDKSQSVYANNTKIQYITSDKSRKIISLTEDMLNTDFSIFVSDSGEDIRKLQIIKDLAMQYASSQQIELSPLMEIVTSNSVADAKMKIKESELKAAKNAEEAQKVQQEMMQLQQQQEQNNQKFQMSLQEVKNATDLQKAEMDNDTKVKVAKITSMGHIHARRQDIDADANKDGVLDVLQVYETELKERKQDLDEKEFEHDKEMDEKLLQQQKNDESES